MRIRVRSAAPQPGTLPPRAEVRDRSEQTEVTKVLTNARSGRHRAAAPFPPILKTRFQSPEFPAPNTTHSGFVDREVSRIDWELTADW